MQNSEILNKKEVLPCRLRSLVGCARNEQKKQQQQKVIRPDPKTTASVKLEHRSALPAADTPEPLVRDQVPAQDEEQVHTQAPQPRRSPEPGNVWEMGVMKEKNGHDRQAPEQIEGEDALVGCSHLLTFRGLERDVNRIGKPPESCAT